jgi:hypothetical protein
MATTDVLKTPPFVEVKQVNPDTRASGGNQSLDTFLLTKYIMFNLLAALEGLDGGAHERAAHLWARVGVSKNWQAGNPASLSRTRTGAKVRGKKQERSPSRTKA